MNHIANMQARARQNTNCQTYNKKYLSLCRHIKLNASWYREIIVVELNRENEIIKTKLRFNVYEPCIIIRLNIMINIFISKI